MERTKVYVCRFGDRSTLQLQWRDAETRKLKTRSAKTENEKAAEALAKELEYELNHGLHVEPSKVSWERFVELFEEEHLGGLRPTSRARYLDALNAYSRELTPGKVSDVTERTLGRYVVALRAGTNAPATIQTKLIHLKAALRWGVEQKFIAQCPKFPKVSVTAKLPRKVSDDEFSKLLEACPTETWRAFLLAAWYTGMRRNELLALTWFDLDFDGQRITVLAETSKGKRNDWIPLHPELSKVLATLPREDGRVFQMKPDTASKTFERSIARKAGVECTLHDLRRSFGSRLAPHVSAPVLQRLMRHRKIETTLKHYVNCEDSLHDALTKLA